MRRGVVLVILFAAFGFVALRLLSSQMAPAAVKLTPVTRGTVVEAVYATGRVDTDQRATVRSRLAAPLLSVLVGPGEAVDRGQLLAILDAREVSLEVARVENEVAAARAAATEAQDAARRLEKLYAAGLVPENELIRERERAQELQQRVEALEKTLRLSEERISWAQLRSPITGTVVNLLRRAGDLLQVGDEVLTVVDLSKPYLRVAVDERDIGNVTPGQEARVVFDAYPQQVFLGRVWRVVPTLDRLTRSADVLVLLPQGIPRLSLDLTATVNIVTKTVSNAILVPRQALRGDGDEKKVLRPNPESKLEAVTIRVGACDLERCEVVVGLQDGDLIVADPTNLQPGMKVRLP